MDFGKVFAWILHGFWNRGSIGKNRKNQRKYTETHGNVIIVRTRAASERAQRATRAERWRSKQSDRQTQRNIQKHMEDTQQTTLHFGTKKRHTIKKKTALPVPCRVRFMLGGFWGPRRAQDGPRGAQDAPKTHQEALKTPPRRPKRRPRHAKMPLGPLLAALGPLLDHLGAILERSWGLPGRFGVVLGCYLGVIFGTFGGQVGPSRVKLCFEKLILFKNAIVHEIM